MHASFTIKFVFPEIAIDTDKQSRYILHLLHIYYVMMMMTPA